MLNRLWSQRYCAILSLSDTPDFGRFSKARAATHITAALAENLPHRSREHEFSAGRVLSVKDTFVLETSLTRVTGLNEWAAGAKSLPCPKDGFDGLSHTDTGTATDLRSFLRRSGMSAVAPEPPPAGHALPSRNIPRLRRDGRASQQVISRSASFTRNALLARLIRPHRKNKYFLTGIKTGLS